MAENEKLSDEVSELNERLAALAERLQQADVHDQALGGLLEQLDSKQENKDEVTKLMMDIRGLNEEHKNEQTGLNMPEAAKTAVVRGRLFPTLGEGEAVTFTPKGLQMQTHEAVEILGGIKAHDTPRTASTFEVAVTSKSATPYFRFAEFKLGTRPRLHKKQDFRIIRELKELAIQQKTRISAMPLKGLLKVITYFYGARLHCRRTVSASLSLPGYVYSALLNRYGLKQVADRKFLQVWLWSEHRE